MLCPTLGMECGMQRAHAVPVQNYRLKTAAPTISSVSLMA